MAQPKLTYESRSLGPRLLFYCQHAMNLGHLLRSTELVLGLGDFKVTFVNAGGVIEGFQLPPSVEVVNLAPLNLNEDFHNARGNGDAPTTETVRVARGERLRAIWQRLRPEILVLEQFPFGIGRFEFELIPLLREVLSTKTCAKVVCSLHEVPLVRNNQVQWEERVSGLVNTYFDLILIHSDPRFQRLEETFGRVYDLCCEVRYTGFVARGPHQLPNGGKPLPVADIGCGDTSAGPVCFASRASALLQDELLHPLSAFTGRLLADAKWSSVQHLAGGKSEAKALDTRGVESTARFLAELTSWKVGSLTAQLRH